LHILG
jgi:hypothetical protein